jgi:hypothetical protein
MSSFSALAILFAEILAAAAAAVVQEEDEILLLQCHNF